jgi:glycosyltransferase involved in cell wall biosynthesis
MNKGNYNILFISHYLRLYGANKSLCTLMLDLRLNYNITPIVLVRAKGEITDFLDENDIKYYISPFYWWVNANKGFFQYFLNLRKQFLNFFRIRGILKMLSNASIDLVYTNSITVNIGVFIAQKLCCPHIWHIREGLEPYGLKFSLGNYLSRLFLKNNTDRYIVISEYLLCLFGSFLPQNRVDRIYNGITLKALTRNENILDEFFNICIVGVLCEQKNQLDALRAIFQLKSEGYSNIKLHLIGVEIDVYANILRNYIIDNKLDDMIVFHGHQTDINNLLQNMNLGLMTSNGEAFGRVTIEYMLKKMPVIASNSGANLELVKDGISGFIYEIYNTNDLVDKIKYFLIQPEQLDLIGKRAFEFAEINFSSEQNAFNINMVIEDVIVEYKLKNKIISL